MIVFEVFWFGILVFVGYLRIFVFGGSFCICVNEMFVGSLEFGGFCLVLGKVKGEYSLYWMKVRRYM